MMMMAQKSPIRASRPRIIIYDFDEDAFEEADMLTDGADGVDVIQIKLLNFRDHYRVHIQCDMRKHSGEGCFVFIGHVGFVDVEGEVVEAEANRVSGVVRLESGRVCTVREGRGEGRRRKERKKGGVVNVPNASPV